MKMGIVKHVPTRIPPNKCTYGLPHKFRPNRLTEAMPSETLRLTIRRADNHSHIIQAGIQDMVAEARKNNLAEYSITEHVSQFAELRRSVEFGSVHASARMFESREEYIAEYIEEFRKIDSRARGFVKLNRGLEVEIFPHGS